MPLRSLLAHQVEAASGIVSQASALSSIGPSELLWIAVSYAAFRSDYRSSSTGCSARTAHAARLITKLVELHTVDHPLNSSIPPIFLCSFPLGLASVPASLIMQLAAGRGPSSASTAPPARLTDAPHPVQPRLFQREVPSMSASTTLAATNQTHQLSLQATSIWMCSGAVPPGPCFGHGLTARLRNSMSERHHPACSIEAE
jgi:hypothetical protein